MDDGGAVFAQPCFGRGGQGGNDIVVFNGIERAELGARGAERRDLRPVDLSGYAAHQLGVPPGQPGLRCHLLEMRVQPMRVKRPALGIERRRKAWMA